MIRSTGSSWEGWRIAVICNRCRSETRGKFEGSNGKSAIRGAKRFFSAAQWRFRGSHALCPRCNGSVIK